MKKYRDDIISIVLSIVLVFFIWHNFLVSGNNIIFVFIFFICFSILKRTLKIINKRQNIISIIISIIFAIIEVICQSINFDFTLNNIINKWLIINLVGYFTIMWIMINWIYHFIDYCKIKDMNFKFYNMKILKKPLLLFSIIFILIVLAWLPYFLKYYPGVVTPDSASQISQVIGESALNNHHPIMHTFILSIFINIGLLLFNNINSAIAIYSIASMLLMALFDVLILFYLYKKKISPIILGIVLLFYMFYPVNAMYSITMWKDILFSGLFPIFLIVCYELLFNTENFLSKKRNIVVFILVSFFMMVLRHNGLYVVVITLPLILIVLRKYWKKVLFMLVLTVVIYEAFSLFVFNVISVEKGATREMLSIPLQQIARVHKYYKDELGTEILKSIDEMFEIENIGEQYDPKLSDPVKFKFKNDYFENKKGEFISIWLQLLVKYPKDYIESFISNSYGYYYPEATNWVLGREILDDYNMGIEAQPKIEWNFLKSLDSLPENRDIPLLSMLFSVGFAFWAIVICLGYKIYLKQYRYIILYLPIMMLWLTCLASPVFCEFRYAYPLFTTLPIYISLNFMNNLKEELDKLKEL